MIARFRRAYAGDDVAAHTLIRGLVVVKGHDDRQPARRPVTSVTHIAG